MKIAWLAQYNVSALQPELKLNREVVQHSSSWIHSLSEFLALDKDVELHILTHSQLIDKNEVIKKNGLFFHLVKYSFPYTKKGFPKYFPYDRLTGFRHFAKEARKIIGEIQPHVLHVHGTEGGYYSPVPGANIPCIVSIQGIISEYIKIEPTLAGYLQIPFEKKAVRDSKYFGCRTNFDHDFVRSINKEAVIFDLPEAMNMVFYKHQWRRPSRLILLFVGSVNIRKGIEDLISCLIKLKAIFPLVQLRIIGSGMRAYIDYLKQIIGRYQLTDNVVWLGSKQPEEVALELSQSSMFILPSLMDNSPNCLAEAMAVGVPSIATKVGGIPSMIDDGVNGLLIDKQDVDGLVDKIRVLANNLDLQDELSRNARLKALERNYPPNVAKKYVEVYKSLIK